MLEFEVTENMIDVMKPHRMTLEIFQDAPIESFLYLELSSIPLTGVDRHPTEYKEEVLEIGPGQLRDRDIWERGYLRIDADGREVALPPTCRLMTRWLQGNVLIVAKTSRWNADPSTYDARHNKMTPDGIRSVIQKSIGI